MTRRIRPNLTSISSGPESDTEPQRVLAVDPGTKRVGLAVSDRLGMIARGLPTLTPTGRKALLRELAQVVRDHNVNRLVLGLPLRLSGEEGPEAEAARLLAGQMEKHLGLPVELWDERLTSVQAERVMVSSGVRRNQRRQEKDRLAAVLILQSWLDAHAGVPEK
jgi:putative Holliday junction resolvase